LYINRSLFTVADKSFIMSISKNNTDLSSYVIINWNRGAAVEKVGGLRGPEA
jgi:hypothetical protein